MSVKNYCHEVQILYNESTFSNTLFSVTDATYTYLDHLLNIDYYDEENDY